MSTTMRVPRWRRWGAAALLGVVGLSGVMPAGAAPWADRFRFVNGTFQEVWAASDQAVAEGRVARSYTWGPQPWFDYKEYYKQSPNGLRQVQYFDKARMEINNPSDSGVRGVTNGLLTVELVSGRVKLGNGTDFGENQQRQPANVPVAGDPANVNPNAPTYATFQGVATVDNGYRDADRSGQRTGTTLDKIGNRTNNPTLAQDAATEIVAYNTVTGHNVPRIFRDFIQNGPVEGLFAFGYPISDPYWVRAKVGGVEKDVFVQLYERRVVTYTPSNPADYRVEMGNVGQHYFQWRYAHLGKPWLPGEQKDLPMAFASKRAGTEHWETFFMDANGTNVRQGTSGRAETVPYSWRRAYIDGASPRLMGDSTRDGGVRRLFSFDLSNMGDVRRHSQADPNTHAFNAAVSPDGTQIALIVQNNDRSTIALVPFDRDNPYVSPYGSMEANCIYQSPTWLPDGSGIVYAANCDGKFAVYRADLQYIYPPAEEYIGVNFVNIRAIAKTAQADNYFPRISPDGKRVVFSSNRNGAGDLYLVNSDGTGERRLTSDAGDDGAGSWSPSGNELIFDSNRDGDYEIYKMDLNGSIPNATQLTVNSVDDRWPLWNQ